MFTVYVIVSIEKFVYVGFTNNLERRLKEHNTGQSQWTKKGTDWKVVYSEEFPIRAEARKREKYLKSHAGKEWLKRRNLIP